MKAELDRKTDPPTMGCGSHAAVGMAVRHWMIPDVRGRVVALAGDGQAICVLAAGADGPKWAFSGVWVRDPATIVAIKTGGRGG